jgi:hypothetical protein
VRRWFEDQVGPDWDVLPGVPAPADPILEKAVRILRDAAAIESASGR